MVIKVARVQDEFTIVLNKGSEDGIADGQRFLIYEIGDIVTDPDTGEMLGELEIVKGTGRATHVQAMICTVASDMVARAGRTIHRTVDPFSRTISQMFASPHRETETLPADKIPFEDVQTGDLAKKI